MLHARSQQLHYVTIGDMLTSQKKNGIMRAHLIFYYFLLSPFMKNENIKDVALIGIRKYVFFLDQIIIGVSWILFKYGDIFVWGAENL